MVSKIDRLKNAAYKASGHVAEELDLSIMVDKYATSEKLEEKLGQIFGKYLTDEFPHIKKDPDFVDFRESIGQSLLYDLQDDIYEMIDPKQNSPKKTSFADTAFGTIESSLEEFGISID